jgi:hypothetical protein
MALFGKIILALDKLNASNWPSVSAIGFVGYGARQAPAPALLTSP